MDGVEKRKWKTLVALFYKSERRRSFSSSDQGGGKWQEGGRRRGTEAEGAFERVETERRGRSEGRVRE